MSQQTYLTRLAHTGKVLEVWIAENGKIAGTDCFDDIVVGKGTFSFSFRGKEATYHVVSNDDRVTRSQALVFATAYHTGNVRRIEVNLRELCNQ